MPISYEEAKALKKELEPEYAGRHFDHGKLREFWHGRFEGTDRGVASLFQDLAKKRDDIGPDIKLVRNLIFEVCVKYQTYLSSLPMIRTFVDEPYTPRKRAQATLKERVLYATWYGADMNKTLNMGGWFGPLMGDWFHGIWPDFERKSVYSIVRSPEYAFPVTGWDDSLESVMFCWKTPLAKAKRAFPTFRPELKAAAKVRGETEELVEILEYSDSKQFMRWVDGQQVNGVEHDLNFNLFEQVPFIRVPGEAWNMGAVEQSVGLVEAGSALHSLLMQAMLENVFPRLILEDPMKFSETIDTGPGAVIPVNPGGKAYYLVPPTNTLQAGAGLLAENERAIKQDTSMPEASFGQFDASIITGKAINELQGAGTGALVEMVQGSGIGSNLVKWNEKALTIYQRMFADDSISLEGVRPASMLDLNPRQFALTFKGKQIIGSPRNEVVFSPHVGMHEKLVISLQAQGAGLTSKKHGREQIGIPDSDAMEEEIFNEKLDEGILGAILQEMTNPTPDAAEGAAQSAAAYLQGKPSQTPPLMAPPPGMPGAMAPGAMMPPGSGAPAGPPGGAAPTPMPMQSLGGAAPPGPAPGGGMGGITLDRAVAAFQALQGISGKLYLVGEIVDTGATPDAVEVAVTDPADRQIVADGVGLPVRVHVVPGEPQEPFVEVTPGSEPRTGGAPLSDELLTT